VVNADGLAQDTAALHYHNAKPMEAQRLTFSLIDTSLGYEATPERVRLAALTEFTADVSKLLRGSNGGIDPALLEVSVRSGSVALHTADIAAAPKKAVSGSEAPRFFRTD
jgi:hypothetical protein